MLFENVALGQYFKYGNSQKIYIKTPIVFNGKDVENSNAYAIGSNSYTHFYNNAKVTLYEASFTKKKNLFKDIKIGMKFYIDYGDYPLAGPPELYMKINDTDKNCISMNTHKLYNFIDSLEIINEEDFELTR